jgi:hypothetical protein
MPFAYVSIWLAMLTIPEAPAHAPAAPMIEQARQTIARSIPFLEKEGVAWIKSKKCISCHRVSFMVWGLDEARQSRISIDEKKLGDWDRWSLANAGENGVEGMGQMIMARQRLGADEKTREALKQLGEKMLAQQKPAGFWDAGGQLPAQKRPKRETIEVSTMWTILALAELEQRTGANTKLAKSREKALAWVKDAKPGISNEWHAVRLLVEKRYGEPKRVDTMLDELLKSQQADGGWAWLRGDKSDALATGQVLYALTVLGRPRSDPVIQRAWKFLIDTQGKDGSWQVNGTKENGKTEPHPTSNYWGTAWATIGLSRSLRGEVK